MPAPRIPSFHDGYCMSDDVTEKSARELFGDGQVASGTREKLLDRATDLFYTYGIHAVGLD